VVLAESAEAVTKYRKDPSIPLIEVVSSFEVFVTGKHGAQGVMQRASQSQLENEFNLYTSSPSERRFFLWADGIGLILTG
jgi:hypothetical protein